MLIQAHQKDLFFHFGKSVVAAHRIYRQDQRSEAFATRRGIFTGGISYEDKGYSDQTDFTSIS